MKKVFFFILSIIFVANTIAQVAWAKPCPNSNNTHLEISVEDDMDCHKKKQEKNTKHCEGICLCDHIQNSQTPFLEKPYNLKKLQTVSQKILSTNETGKSRHPSPQRRPPRQIS